MTGSIHFESHFDTPESRIFAFQNNAFGDVSCILCLSNISFFLNRIQVIKVLVVLIGYPAKFSSTVINIFD